MKTFTIGLIVLIAMSIKTNAQIPNNGFENWSTIGDCLEPDGWGNINDWMGTTEDCNSVSQSSDHYPATVGSYSIKIENNLDVLPDAGAFGMVWTGDNTGFGTDNPVFAITGHPTSLCGYYKFLPENGDTMDIHYVFYKNGAEVTQGKLWATATVSTWTSFNIPVTDPSYLDADSARILMSSFNSDNPVVQGNSVLYVDNLRFDVLINSVPDQGIKKTFFNLYPNPASDIITLSISNSMFEDLELDIYNGLGLVVQSEILMQNQPHQINVGNLSNGIYLVTIKSKDVTQKQNLIIQR